MIRERQLSKGVLSYSSGAVQSIELPKDAVYHQLQLVLTGTVPITYGASQTNSAFQQGFPFNLISKIKLMRNGSDTVWQGSGEQLAKEALYLNSRYPQARLYDTSGGSNANKVLVQSLLGQSIPANSEGIGCNAVQFEDYSVASSTVTTSFRAMMELWLQLGVDDAYYASLVDARPLASFTLEITWANAPSLIKVGTAGTLGAVTGALQVMSYDQDNVATGIPFGTFKRSSFSATTWQFGSSQNQQLLPRGNFYYGILLQSMSNVSAAPTGYGTTLPVAANDILGQIQNRINSNYLLRNVDFLSLQNKNRNDGVISASPYDVFSGAPQGWAMLDFVSTGDTAKELVPTFTMDQFDLLVDTGAASGGPDGFTYSGNPTVNFLTQEVIPGRSISPNSPQGAFAGSIAATTAKPGR